MPIFVKRAYDPPAPGDGCRIFVDRLWPRGITKGEARIDLWLKDVAPSTALRKWFGHAPAKWDEFQARYRQELSDNGELVARIVEQARQRTVTLVYGAKDTEHNGAVLLKALVESELE